MKFSCTISKIQMISSFVYIWYTLTDGNGKGVGDAQMVCTQELFKEMSSFNYTVGSVFTRVDEFDGKVLTSTWQP